MNPALVQFDDLKAITGYDRLSDVERCLERCHIRFFRGRGTVWTTLDLINAAGGITPAAQDDKYSPDIIG